MGGGHVPCDGDLPYAGQGQGDARAGRAVGLRSGDAQAAVRPRGGVEGRRVADAYGLSRLPEASAEAGPSERGAHPPHGRTLLAAPAELAPVKDYETWGCVSPINSVHLRAFSIALSMEIPP